MSEDKFPDCYGLPEEVAPLGQHGFPEPQDKCIPCPHLKSCLRKAWLKRHPSEESKFPPEENEMVVKIGRFWRRWSRRKLRQTDI